MTLRIGVIGVGVIGQDHIRRLTRVLSGAQVVAVSDVDAARAQEVADGLSMATVHATGQELVADGNVDAVVVTSWGETHEEYVLACIDADKPVFCEKPLATTQEACLRIMGAEMARGRRLVQVGYNRRYDEAYRALKEVIDSGAIGSPLIVHSGHRNPSVPPHYTRDMAIVDTAVHDIDVVRWLLAEEMVATTVLTPRKSRHGGDLQDPLLLIMESESGVLVDVEISVNIRYGYDIRGEVVGEDGTVMLADTAPVILRREGSLSGRVPETSRERFLRAYDVEFQEWIDAVTAGQGATGPSCWDGYAAAAVGDAALEAMNTGVRTTVDMRKKPDFYDKAP